MKTLLQLVLFSFVIFGQVLHAQCEIEEDFDTYVNNDIPVDWTVINTTGSTNNVYAKVQTSNQAPTPPRFLRMYNGAETTGDLIFVAPQLATVSDGNHRVKFWLQGTSTSMLELGTMNATDGSGTFTLISTFNLSNNWTYYEVIIPSGSNEYLAFKHNLGDPFDQINFDSICIQEIPTCLEVSNIGLSNQTTTTVDLSWDESGTGEDNWEYIVQEIGSTSPTPTTSGTAHNSTSSTPSVTVSGLTMNTEYEAYVRANCGGGDFGEWIFTGNTLRTDCGLVTENFCEDWAGLPEDMVPFCWSAYDDPGTSGYVYIDYEFSYAKNMLELFFTSTTVVGDIVAISPDVSFAMDGTHRLNFTAGGSTNVPDLLEVGTIDTGGNFVLITSITPTADRNTQYLVELPDNDHAKFAFRHNGAINKYIWINTICVESTPSCLEVTNVAASNVQYNAADINWTVSGSNETTWEYLVQETTLPAPDATTNGTEIMATSVNVPLAQNTAYVAYVRAKCDATDFGAWIASAEFTTSCDSVVAEYSDSFEGLNVSGQEVKPCWSFLDTTSGDFRTYDSQNNITPADGNLMLRMFFSSSSDPEGLVLSTPETSDISTDKQIRFKMNKSTSTTEGFSVIVGTMSDPLDATTFVILDDTSVNETSVDAETWTEFTIDFANYDTSLNHSYIAFKPQHSGNGSNFKNIYMDDYIYEFNPVVGFNDEAITAAVLTASNDYSCNNAISGDFLGATQSDEYPCTSTVYEDFSDLWFRFTPDATGEYAFSLENVTGEEMNMFLFEGSSVNPISLVGGCSTRYVTEHLEEGVTYFVSIASEILTAQFELCVYPLPPVPVNDETTGALVINESTDNSCNNAVSGYTASATHSIESECSSESLDVWYTFTPTNTANYTFRRDIIQGGGVTFVSVYEGTPGNLTQLTELCTSYLQTVDLIAGETYYVAVSSSLTSIPVYFNLCAYQSPPAPGNDECVDGYDLTVGVDFESSYIIGDNTSATRNTADPLVICDGLEFELKGKDVWYSVIVPNSGRLVLETKSNDDPYLTDPGMMAYAGTCGALETIYCSSDQGDGFFTYMELENLQPGSEVLVRVWGRVGTFGSYKIAAYDDGPICEFPANVQVDDITETTALLTFDAPTPAPTGGYEYIVQLEGTGYPGDATGITTTSTEVLLSDLTPDTNYEVYVKSICSDNGSAWEGPALFTTEMVLGTNNFTEDAFSVYPNPVKDRLTISNATTIELVTIYDYTGKRVKQVQLNNTEGQIDMSTLASGLYMLEVKTALNKKVVKVIVE